jgi:hypothetical protein
MSDTEHLALPLIAAAQSQKHVTHNEALSILDALTHLAVISQTVAAPPASPGEGDRYLVAAGASGVWSSHDGEIAFYLDGVWHFATPRGGFRLWSADDEKLFVFDGAAWRDVSDIEVLQNMDLLGVNATADGANRLSVASANVLFSHDGHDHRLKINKHAAGDSASVVMQDGFSGRAELGLAGDDDFHLKVSADGSAWHEAMVAKRASGKVSFPAGLGGPFGAVAAPAIVLEEQQNATTSAGAYSTANVWQKRTLNTIVYDPLGLTSLASDEFTLPAGTWYVRYHAPAVNIVRHRCRLYNVTDAMAVSYGSSEAAGTGTATRSEGGASLNIASAKTFRVEHFATAANTNSTALGASCSAGVNNTYAVVQIWQGV